MLPAAPDLTSMGTIRFPCRRYNRFRPAGRRSFASKKAAGPLPVLERPAIVARQTVQRVPPYLKKSFFPFPGVLRRQTKLGGNQADINHQRLKKTFHLIPRPKARHCRSYAQPLNTPLPGIETSSAFSTTGVWTPGSTML